MTDDSNPMQVIGLGAEGPAGLSAEAIAHIERASLLVGGKRNLAFFPDFAGERLTLEGDLKQALDRLRRERQSNTVILASGDPLFFGIGKLLLEHFERDELVFWPHVSSVQLAFARIKESWHDARVVSLHGRPLDTLTPVLDEGAPRIALLTDERNTPAAIARLLRETGRLGYTLWVCENLGAADEQVSSWSPGELRDESFAPLNVVILSRARRACKPPEEPSEASRGCKPPEEQQEASNADSPLAPVLGGEGLSEQTPHAGVEEDEARDSSTSLRGLTPPARQIVGIPDQCLNADPPGMITPVEVRLIALARLELQADAVLWDIGAGSGSVSLEAARLAPSLKIHAIEKSPTALEQARSNARRLGVTTVHFHEGEAPACLAGLPDPDAVFLGGSGGKLCGILEAIADRLRPGGRLVLNCVTLESLSLAWDWLTRHDWQPEATQVQLARSQPLGRWHAFEPSKPVFVLAGRRPQPRVAT